MYFQIELTNHCNLSCYECPHVFIERQKTVMDDSILDVIINDYIPKYNPETVILHKDGEPLLYPKLKEAMTKISAISNCKFDIYTNGLLVDQCFVDFIQDIPNKICLLMSFHFFNHDGKRNDYTKASQIIRKMILGNKKKNLEIVFVSHKTDLITQDELEKWKNEWEPLKKFGYLSAIHINPVINKWAGKVENGNSMFDSCPYADGMHLFFGVTGKILPCCMDLEEEVVFGNVFDDIDFVMDNRRKFYSDLNNGIVRNNLCERCLEK